MGSTKRSINGIANCRHPRGAAPLGT
jgi:hypothetical protein